jgi:hypothetical protein
MTPREDRPKGSWTNEQLVARMQELWILCGAHKPHSQDRKLCKREIEQITDELRCRAQEQNDPAV